MTKLTPSAEVNVALITDIKLVPKERQNVHAETECTASVLNSTGGRRYLQLDTYGSGERKLKGKVSQSIQLSEQAAGQLKKLIEQTFPSLQ
jgi:hypothetical protein